MIDTHILLYGAASTGKSAVGAILAERLGLPLVDGLERQLAKDMGRPLADIRASSALTRGYQEWLFLIASAVQLFRAPSVITTPELLVSCYNKILLPGWTTAPDFVARRSIRIVLAPAPVIESDGFRVDDLAWNLAFHERLCQVVEKRAGPFALVPWAGTVEEKAERCLDIARRWSAQ
jgi:hypothetical protein